ncbi:DUF1294 domain-containing protein [Methylophilus rhizosphaerae]|uniref:DUF1294 domain-containing protein n=1 Tax=Methylophilus rhizosphaerae TaxID=492660 RepID=UPI000B85F9A6
MFSLLFTAVFIIALAISILTGKLPLIILWLYLVTGSLTFIIYASDKSAATRKQRRIPEKMLHLLALIGGWPGAVMA